LPFSNKNKGSSSTYSRTYRRTNDDFFNSGSTNRTSYGGTFNSREEAEEFFRTFFGGGFGQSSANTAGSTYGGYSNQNGSGGYQRTTNTYTTDKSKYYTILGLNKNASQDEIKKAAEEIEVNDFIEKLPNGYHFIVSERGSSISLGQRQLLSFLRAYLVNPKILILDEATSSIDHESEKLIQKATEKITKNRTSIIIAHRLSTIEKADKIIVMHQGEIVEMGTHQELLNKGGYYTALNKKQEPI